jgi:Helix-turn-helix domain
VTIRPEDWEILGIEPGADIGQVRRAYRHRRSLYEPAALATYNLLDDEEREGMVDRIEDAYRRIIGSEPPAAPPAPPPAANPAPATRVVIGDAPDPLSEPGAHLRFHRNALGFTLHQIALETKIGVPILEQIENEDFEALPAPAFVRGHVHQFARELKLADAYEFAKFYLTKMQGGGSEVDE